MTNLVILISLSVSLQVKSNTEPPRLTGPYLGQTPPGSTPTVFAPGYVSTLHRDTSVSLTPDMTEFYFSRMDVNTEKWWLIRFKLENNQWYESVVGPRVGRPILSPDGNTMHLGNQYMERTRNGWSKVKSMGPMFDRNDWGIMRLAASANGTYVFDDYKNNDVIRISTMTNGQRQPPKLMGAEINSGKWTAHPFIAPDASFIIWDSEKVEGYGQSDLYISFPQQDNSWSQGINLGDSINTNGYEAGAYVSPDGKYLFFNRHPLATNDAQDTDVDIYWVDASIIETLRAKYTVK